MAPVMPQTSPWMTPVRGNSEGDRDRHTKTRAPTSPGSVYRHRRTRPVRPSPGPPTLRSAAHSVVAVGATLLIVSPLGTDGARPPKPHPETGERTLGSQGGRGTTSAG